MRFLADMGVSNRIVDWLRQRGDDVAYLPEQGLERLEDGKIFTKAATEERIILTFDLDFGELLAQSRGLLVSVVLFRLNNTMTQFVIRRLNTVLADCEESLRTGAIVVVDDGRHRIRRLPVGES